MDVEVVHKTAGENRFERALAVLVGIAAILAALLATLEMHSSRRWEESSIRAANLSVELFGKIAATGPISGAAAGAEQAALLTGTEAAARVSKARDRELELFLALVDDRVSARLLQLSKTLGPPAETDGGMGAVSGDLFGGENQLDPTVLDVLATDTAALGEIAAMQRDDVEASDRYGSRISRALFSLSLLALAAILLGLGAVLGLQGGGVITLTAALIAMLVAAGWGATALFI
ncbi:MAG: hypothetical protein M3198_12945 [Actinomycetota bacterium]|nr:hypothetical protein [Actinomycetota bacterium]